MAQPLLFYRGYTCQEHLDQFKLINLNGRMYDPVLGRFLSPDNLVGMPGSTQGYNRYTYAMNNPLKYIDPDGECPILIAIGIGMLVGAMTGTAYGTYMANQTGDNSLIWKYAISGAIGGGLGAGFAALAPVVGAGVGVMNGAVYGAITTSLTTLASNGITNALTGRNFFDNWERSLISGAITGAISGGIMGGMMAAENENTNIWWGGSIAKNRNKWSFINIDRPDKAFTKAVFVSGNPNIRGGCCFSAMESIARGNNDKLDAQFFKNEFDKYMNMTPEGASKLVEIDNTTGGIPSNLIQNYMEHHLPAGYKGKQIMAAEVYDAVKNGYDVFGSVHPYKDFPNGHSMSLQKVASWSEFRYQLRFNDSASPYGIYDYYNNDIGNIGLMLFKP